MNIILMGCPGAGKGTQSAKLKERFALKHISTGDVLREEIASGSALGKQVAQQINQGNLVPDSLMISLLEQLVKENPQGIIFDGFPRTVAQAEALDEMMKRLGREITHVIMIDLPEGEVVSRICARRQCKTCGSIFHMEAGKPLTKCPACGGELYIRSDDTPARAKHRLEVYHRDTLPVKNYYQHSGKYRTVDGAQAPNQVFEDLVKILAK